LIYGFDYTSDELYDKMIKNKRIEKKMRLSVMEFKTGLRMLEIPYEEIDSPRMLEEVIRFLSFEKSEKTVDPRL